MKLAKGALFAVRSKVYPSNGKDVPNGDAIVVRVVEDDGGIHVVLEDGLTGRLRRKQKKDLLQRNRLVKLKDVRRIQLEFKRNGRLAARFLAAAISARTLAGLQAVADEYGVSVNDLADQQLAELLESMGYLTPVSIAPKKKRR